MRLLIIDPTGKTTTAHHPTESGAITRLIGSRRKVCGRLPNGDYILSSREAVYGEAFSFGGSAPVVGVASVVGKKNEIGCYTSSRSDLQTVSTLVKCSSESRHDARVGVTDDMHLFEHGHDKPLPCPPHGRKANRRRGQCADHNPPARSRKRLGHIPASDIRHVVP